MLLTEGLGEEDVAKSDEKVVDETKPEEKESVEPDVKPVDVDVAIEQDEVFEVEAEVTTETTGAAAKSRAQVLSPEDRKAELRARFARAPARVRQLQRETEVDPESLVRDHAKKRLAAQSGAAS